MLRTLVNVEVEKLYVPLEVITNGCLHARKLLLLLLLFLILQASFPRPNLFTL